MFRRNALIVLAAGVLVSSSVRAMDPPPERTLLVDAVALVAGTETPGRAELFADRDGYRYLFSTAEHQAAFEAEPDRYEIQLGGACAKMGPLTGRGTTALYAVHDGRIFIFASESCKETFLKDPAARADRADAKPEPSPESLARGRELVGLLVQGLGGAANIDALASVRMESRWTQRSGQKDYARRKAWTVRFPGEYRLDDDWGEEYPCAMVAGHDGAFFAMKKIEDMHRADRFALEQQFYRHPLVIARARARPDFIAFGAAPAGGGSTPAGERLGVWFAGTLTHLTLDPASGRVLAIAYRARGKGAAIGEIEVRPSAFHESGGVAIPTSAQAWYNGERWEGGDVSVGAVVLDRASDQDFKKPANRTDEKP